MRETARRSGTSAGPAPRRLVPSRVVPLSTLLAVPLLLAVACSSGGAEPSGGAAGACLTGTVDCPDVPTGTGGPVSGSDGALPLAEAVAAGVDGPFAVRAYYLADGDDERLCEALAESFPPQCGGPSLALDNTAGLDLGPLESEGAVSWSPQAVVLTGEIVDGTLVTR